MPELLIAGCGYVGCALPDRLDPTWKTWGLRRQASALPASITPIVADLLDAQLAARLPDVSTARFDAVVIAVAAKQSSPEAYERTYVQGVGNLLAALRQRGQRPRRVVFTSSTAVYHQEGGEWVDETSPTQPTHFRGQWLLRAEAQISEWGGEAVVVRFGGIYGPGRTRLIESARQGPSDLSAEAGPQYGNRIHRDDCAAVLAHVVGAPRPQALYLGVDHEPADKREVLHYLRTRLGLPSTPPVAGGTASGKRCDSARLRRDGFVFRFPTFREGYGALL